jgi:hypothetical protein
VWGACAEQQDPNQRRGHYGEPEKSAQNRIPKAATLQHDDRKNNRRQTQWRARPNGRQKLKTKKNWCTRICMMKTKSDTGTSESHIA